MFLFVRARIEPPALVVLIPDAVELALGGVDFLEQDLLLEAASDDVLNLGKVGGGHGAFAEALTEGAVEGNECRDREFHSLVMKRD